MTESGGPADAGEDPLVARVVEHLSADPGRSVVLQGPAGIGKTHLANAVLDHLVALAPEVRPSIRRVAGGEALRHLDFGALLHLLSLDDSPVTAEFELVQRFRRSIVQQAHRTVLLIDDVGLLDVKSAAIIESLLRTGDVLGLITERTTSAGDRDEAHHLSGVLADLAESIIVQPLTGQRLDDLVTEWAGPGEVGSVRRIAAMSEGNPLAVRELLASASAANAIVRRDGLWFLTDFAPRGRSLEDLVDSHLARLTQAEWDLLQTVVIAGSVPRTVLARLDIAALELLERAGLVGGDPSEALHPLYAEVIRGRLRGEEGRRLSTKLASAVGPDDGADLARLGRWMLDSGAVIDDNAARRGAAIALGRWENRLASDLLAAIDEPTVGDLVQSLWAHANDGDLEEASRFALAAVEAASTETERVDAGLARAELLILQMGRSVEGYELIEELRSTLTRRDQRERVDAATALYMQMTGRGALAADVIEESSRSTVSDTARLPTLIADAFGKVFSGSFDVAADVIVEADGLARQLRQPHNVVRVAIVDALRHLLSGRLDHADRLIDSALDAADMSSVGPAHAAWLGIAAQSASMRGHIDRARRRSSEAVRAADHVDDLGAGGFVRGEHRAMLIELGVAVEPDPRESPAGRCRADVRALHDDDPRADALATRLARSTVDAGYVLWAPWIAMEAVRRGPAPESTALVVELAASIDGPVYAAFADHALGGVSGDCDQVDHAVAVFESIGARSLALDARLTAVDVAEQAGQSDVRIRRRLVGVRSDLAAVSPRSIPRIGRRLEHMSKRFDMPTERQFEIAALVAQGLSSKEVAAQLIVSARTVDNHLAAVYRKLGLSSRAELTELL